MILRIYTSCKQTLRSCQRKEKVKRNDLLKRFQDSLQLRLKNIRSLDSKQSSLFAPVLASRDV